MLIVEFGFDNIKQIWHNIALKFILIRFTVITQKVKYYQCFNQENFHVQMKRSFIKFIWDISITFCTFSFYRDFQPFILFAFSVSFARLIIGSDSTHMIELCCMQYNIVPLLLSTFSSFRIGLIWRFSK